MKRIPNRYRSYKRNLSMILNKEEKYLIELVGKDNKNNTIMKYAISGQKYVFRRKGLLSLVLKIIKPFSEGIAKTSHKKLHLPIYKTIFFQLIYLVLGKGECQYLIEN